MITNPSASQSGIFTPRILCGVALCFFGLLLAIFSVAGTPPAAEMPRAVTVLPDDPRSFQNSPGMFGANAKVLPPGVPLPPGARFAPAGQGDLSSSDPTALFTGSSGMPLTSSPQGGWSIVPSPNALGEIYHFLEAVTCVSASDCWAVGYRNIPPGGPNYRPQTLIEHWDGTAWTIVDTPNVGVAVENVLRGVTCVSASDCWAVGNYESDSFQRTLILHWDGTSWAIVASPNEENTPPRPNRLSEVACTSTSDCWAVGVANFQAFILRWNGTSWQKFPQAQPAGSLTAVTCVSASDCWAVGSRVVNNVEETFIEHWDGTVWTVVPGPLPGVLSSFADVTCVSASDCWAVGRYRAPFNVVEEPLIARWDGTSWTLVLSPLPGFSGFLESVTCASTSDCWAVGRYFADT
ncbi:MAG: hypothetical protein LC776_07255, partial [Acidobacteria bacterium]|nr:hypothetical protein [Acidobacteriota bacterium]